MKKVTSDLDVLRVKRFSEMYLAASSTSCYDLAIAS